MTKFTLPEMNFFLCSRPHVPDESGVLPSLLSYHCCATRPHSMQYPVLDKISDVYSFLSAYIAFYGTLQSNCKESFLVSWGWFLYGKITLLEIPFNFAILLQWAPQSSNNVWVLSCPSFIRKCPMPSTDISI